MTFGGLDASKFDASTLVTVDNVSQDGFWEAAMDGVSADGQDLGLQGRSAILDTGTTLIIAPQADADAVHAAIPGAQSDGQGGYTIPCTSNTSVALGFGGSQFAINPVDLLFTPVDPNDPTGDCVSGISAGEIDGATTWLVSLSAECGCEWKLTIVRVDWRCVPQERLHVCEPEQEPDLTRKARLSLWPHSPTLSPRTDSARPRGPTTILPHLACLLVCCLGLASDCSLSTLTALATADTAMYPPRGHCITLLPRRTSLLTGVSSTSISSRVAYLHALLLLTALTRIYGLDIFPPTFALRFALRCLSLVRSRACCCVFPRSIPHLQYIAMQ